MDKNAFQTEMNRVAFTPAGREALTEALMKGKAAPARRSGGWARRSLAAALAAVVLAGSALAAGTLWERYFGRLDETQQEIIETLSRELPAAESNGTTMTPLAAFGDQDFYYLMLEIRAPEGTVLPDYGEDEGYYQLFGDELGEKITLTDEDGQELPRYVEFEWMPRTGEDNVLTAVLRLWPAEGVDFSDGTDKVLHIPGLWVQSPDKVYTPVLTGGWDFNIGAHCGNVEIRELDVTGVTQGTEEFGTLVLDSLRLSPLGMRWRAHWTSPQEGIWPGAEIAVMMEDGREVSLDSTMGGCQEDWSEDYGPFETPIDLNQVTAVRWGGVLIPVEGE